MGDENGTYECKPRVRGGVFRHVILQGDGTRADDGVTVRRGETQRTYKPSPNAQADHRLKINRKADMGEHGGSSSSSKQGLGPPLAVHLPRVAAEGHV